MSNSNEKTPDFVCNKRICPYTDPHWHCEACGQRKAPEKFAQGLGGYHDVCKACEATK